MVIKRKEDVKTFLGGYMDFFEWDGNKYYLTVNDTKIGGSITFMRYPNDGPFSIYRKNNRFWDLKESQVNLSEMISFFWSHRKEINNLIRNAP